MNNNYKILKTNYDKSKIFKIDNIKYLKEKNNLINKANFSFIKIVVVLLLFTIIKFKITYPSKENVIKQYEIGQNTNPENKENFDIIPNSKNFWNSTFLKNEMHSYGLYNAFKSPKISIILMNMCNPRLHIYQIVNQIKNIVSQNISNIEIILDIDNRQKKEYNIIARELGKLLKNDILRIYNKKKQIKEDYSNIINLIKGFYAIFINDYNSLENIPFQQIFEYEYNDIKNYFYFNISNDSNIYLIKTKSIKDCLDNGIEFSSFNEIIENIKSIPFPQINFIPISLCPSNFFTNLAYVTMSSILSSKDSSTYVCFYLIISSDFEDKNIKFINSLHEIYEYFNVTYIRMDGRYNKAYTDRRITTQAYYRFSLGEILPKLNKIIYFDTDIIVYKDLGNFYNLNFNGKMILGQPTYGNKKAQRLGFHRINTGILLMNLLEMRKNNFESKVIEVINKGKKFRYHDQTLLNDYFKEYLGIFPPEYHTRPWSNYKEMEIFNKRIGRVFDQDYFYFVHKYPTIRHFLGGYKPRDPNINHIEDWWFFARKSKYYNKDAKTYDSAFSF